MRYVLGVDIGNIKTQAVVADEAGNLLGWGSSCQSQNDRDDDPTEQALRAVQKAIDQSLRMAELENRRIATACFCLPRNSILQESCEQSANTEHIIFETPAKAALYSVTLGGSGISVSAGFSSSAMGRNEQGAEATAGGWGAELGDEGSSRWIAIRALNACCRAFDGIGPPTLLQQLIPPCLTGYSISALTKRTNMEMLSAFEVSAISETVSRAAQQDDSVAKKMLRDAGRELGALAGTVAKRLQLNSLPVKVGTVGGVFRSGRSVLRTFREELHSWSPHAVVISPQLSTAAGAALLAIESISGKLTAQQLLAVDSSRLKTLI